MAGQVKFILEADAAKAVQGFLKIVDSQKKIESGQRDIGKVSKDTEGILDGLGAKARNFAAGFLTLDAAKTVVTNLTDELQRAFEMLKQFQGKSKGGKSVGDNVDNKNFDSETIAMSNKYGASAADVVAPLREKIAVGSSDLTPEQQNLAAESALKVQQTTGASAETVAELQDNLQDAYQEMTLQQTENFILFMRNKGGLNPQEAAGVLPAMLPSMSQHGIADSSLAAMLGTIQQTGGATSQMGKAATGLLSKIPGMKEEGLVSKDADLMTAVQELDKLRESDPAKFEKEVGKRLGPTVAALAKRRDVYDQLETQYKGFTGDQLGSLQGKMLADPNMKAAMEGEQIAQMKANEMLKPAARDTLMGWEKKKAGAEMALPVGWKWASTGLAGFEAGAEKLSGALGVKETRPDAMSFQNYAQFRLDQQANAPSAAKVGARDIRDRVKQGLVEYTPTDIAGMDAENQVAALVQKSEKAGSDTESMALAKQAEAAFKKLESTATALEAAAKKIGDNAGKQRRNQQNPS